MFTPSNPIEATNPIVTAQRQDVANCQNKFSDIRSSDPQQVFSNTWSPDYKQRFSDEKFQTTSNQNDACPRH